MSESTRTRSRKQRSYVLRPRNSPCAGKIRQIASGSWRGKPRVRIASSGYVAHSLEAALWCVASTADFETAVLKAANLGDDADRAAAIAGQLAGDCTARMAFRVIGSKSWPRDNTSRSAPQTCLSNPWHARA
jgi:hypothetical protein